MTINRYLVEGVLRDIQKGRRVVVVLAGPLFLETTWLWNLLAQLTQEAPDLLEGISSHRTNGQDPLQCESTGGRATFCTLRSLDRMRGHEFDVLVSPDVPFSDRLWKAAAPAMATSQHREVIR